jgi:hypothetical protein
MISLIDRIEINTTADKVFAWLGSMPQQYTSWHPDHVSCRVLKGSMFEVGSEMECEEYLHGKLHKMRFRVLEVYPGRRIEYGIVGMGRGAFEIEGAEGKVSFIAELRIGSDIPLIGQLVDIVFRIFFSGRLLAMREHMAEEGRNLKAILEAD